MIEITVFTPMKQMIQNVSVDLRKSDRDVDVHWIFYPETDKNRANEDEIFPNAFA